MALRLNMRLDRLGRWAHVVPVSRGGVFLLALSVVAVALAVLDAGAFNATSAAKGVAILQRPPWFRGLPPLQSGWGSTPNGISADGKIVVGYTNSEAARWIRNALSAYSIAGLGYPGAGTSSSATGANANGTVIAGIGNNAGQAAPVVWVNGTWTLLPQNYNCCGNPLPPCGAVAYGVNADAIGLTLSVVVGQDGSGNPGCGPGIPVEWVNGVEVAFLGWSPSGSGDARAVSADGSVIVGRFTGQCSPPNQTQYSWEAFRWTSSGGLTDLGDLGGCGSIAYATNANGSVIVGTANTSNTDSQPFRWTAATGMVGICPAAVYATAFAVNADGSVVVGQTHGDAGQAFRWTAATGCQNIADLLTAAGVNLTGWHLIEAFGISADGTIIAGNGAYGSQGQGWVAYLPLPAPSGIHPLEAGDGGRMTP